LQQGASDQHITLGVPPQARLDGTLRSIADVALASADTKPLARNVMTDAQKQRLRGNKWEAGCPLTGSRTFHTSD